MQQLTQGLALPLTCTSVSASTLLVSVTKELAACPVDNLSISSTHFVVKFVSVHVCLRQEEVKGKSFLRAYMCWSFCPISYIPLIPTQH